MAISLASLRRGGEVKPQRFLIYGTGGVGKTSLAAGAPNPVFIQTEDGAIGPNAQTFGLLTSFAEVLEATYSLFDDESTFKGGTVVYDTVDWLEPMLWKHTASLNGWSAIDDGSKGTDYGKGYAAANVIWRELMEGTNALRDQMGMTVIFLAHAEIKRFESPEVEPFERYQPKLQKGASAILQENVDHVLFNAHSISIVKDQGERDKKGEGRARGVGGGGRVLHTEERPAYLAKNRAGMPPTIRLPNDPAAAWSALATHIPFFNQTAQHAEAAE